MIVGVFGGSGAAPPLPAPKFLLGCLGVAGQPTDSGTKVFVGVFRGSADSGTKVLYVLFSMVLHMYYIHFSLHIRHLHVYMYIQQRNNTRFDKPPIV